VSRRIHVPSPSPAPAPAADSGEVPFRCECVTPERRLYRLLDHDGGSSLALLCDDCAALAAMDWNGETHRVTAITDDLNEKPKPRRFSRRHHKLTPRQAASRALRQLHTVVRRGRELDEVTGAVWQHIARKVV